MRYYELLYIVNPNLEDERVNSIIEEIGTEINNYNVNIINHHIWGKKRLAYPVNNNKYGIYILLQFEAEKFDFLNEFERYLILSKTVIRHQIVRLEEEPKKVESIEIDEDSDSSVDDEFDVSDVDSKNGADDTEEKEVEIKTDKEEEKDDTKEESNEDEKQEEGKE